MARKDDLNKLPEDLPVPFDDGACDHLIGQQVPSVSLVSTADQLVDLSKLQGRTVVYSYPRTGKPDQNPPQAWNEIPGARGCTPQSCTFRDHYQELQALDTAVYGLSTQDTDYQKEAVERLHLPFQLLSDEKFDLIEALTLPTFGVESMRLIKRLTLILCDGLIEHVVYPVFPPDESAEKVLQWLNVHAFVSLNWSGDQ